MASLVRSCLDALFTYCEDVDRDELRRLMDLDHCRASFGLAYALAVPAAAVGTDLHTRYWVDPFIVAGQRVRVTSQWHERHRQKFAAYLISLGLGHHLPSDLPVDAEVLAAPSSAGTARYKSPVIGNAQNYFVRNLLSRIGNESFTEKDWLAAVQHFDGRCAYCGEFTKLVMDHAVAINRTSLGEHRLGNLVPACADCNSAKSQKSYAEFAAHQPEVLARIADYMESRGYQPLGEHPEVRALIEEAHAEVGRLASTYVDRINAVLSDDTALPDAPTTSGGQFAFPFKILRAVEALHAHCYQQVRVVPSMSPSGGHWRVTITAPGGDETLHYTSAAGSTFADRPGASDLSIIELSALILASLPQVERRGAHFDREYASWYSGLLQRCEANGALPIAFADYFSGKDGWKYGGPGLYPLPPDPLRD